MSRCGVILCECNGALERRISLQELSRFIRDFNPDIDIVTGNDLCKTDELQSLIAGSNVHPSVIGACSKIQNKAALWQDIDAANGSNPFFTKIVDILSEISSDFSDYEVSERIKLLLTSQISKGFSCSDILQDNIRLHFSPSHTEVTRRNLITSMIPQYEVIPAILHDDCLGNSCQLCADVCPTGAILSSNDTVKIDKASCTGCGACVNTCPIGAVSYPGFSTLELEREIEALLSNQVDLPYRILSIACQSCFDAEAAEIKNCSSSLLTIKVPSLIIVSPLLILNAFNMGVDGIALIHDEEHCTSKIPRQPLINTVTFIKQLLDRWGIDKNRMELIDKVNSNLGFKLSRFAENISGSGHTRFKSAPGSLTFEGMYNLAAIIKEMDSKLQITEYGLLSGDHVPFGIANVDSTRCTGCGVCAHSCPTGAIKNQTSGDPPTFKLVFNHSRCITCGLCIDKCPEKCMNISKAVDFAKLSDFDENIFENEFMYCRNCNKPYAAKSMIDILKRKLEESGILGAEWTEYCPVCRVAIQQKR